MKIMLSSYLQEMMEGPIGDLTDDKNSDIIVMVSISTIIINNYNISIHCFVHRILYTFSRMDCKVCST